MKNPKSALLASFLLITISTCFAQTSTAPAVGTGTAANPYRIATLDNLYWLSQNSAQWVSGKYFIQTGDIDASATSTWFSDGSGGYYGFPCIGGDQTIGNQLSATFNGNYDGLGYVISNLYINRPNDKIALFGDVGTATVKNLRIVNPYVRSRSSTGSQFYGVAVLTGYSINLTVDNIAIEGGSVISNGAEGCVGTIGGWVNTITSTNSSSTASVTISVTGFSGIGGFVGLIGGTAVFTNCFATGNVSSTVGRCGGFVGDNTNSVNATFNRCYATGNVTGTGICGGFTGMLYNPMRFNDCYANGNVNGGSSTAGGFFGWTWNNSSVANTIFTNCYATGAITGSTKGGFGSTTNGYAGIVFNNCFWDTQTSGLSNAVSGSTPTGVTGQTTAQMKTGSTFTGAGWDFITETTNGSNDYWFIDATYNAGYPALVSNTREWTGGTSTSWTDASNWRNSILPGSTSIVKILSSATYLPAISSDITLDRFSFNGVNNILDLGSYNLICTQVLAYDATKYIKTSGTGVLKMNIGNTRLLTFPTGNSAFNPVVITNNSGSADDFSVKVLDEVYVNGTGGSPVSANRVQRTWDISKTNANGGTGISFLFNWNSGETSAAMATPSLYHYASGWSKQTGTTSSTATSLTYTGYTGTFSPFAVVDGSSILPVIWSGFTASKQGKTVVLNWSTASEERTVDYTIQHSVNGIDWNDIGTKTAAGTTTISQYYSFVHNNPATGNNYYRLIQRDVDGRKNYSKTVLIDFTITGKLLSIYPNPVVNGLLSVKLDKATTIYVYNGIGMLVLQKDLQSGTHQLGLEQLPEGIYHIKAGAEAITFMKQ